MDYTNNQTILTNQYIKDLIVKHENRCYQKTKYHKFTLEVKR